jgi:hypothetical protein
MTDASDRLFAERFAALADPHDDSDWLDVRRRAGCSRKRRRAWVVVPLAAALTALVVGSALAYYGDVVDFVGAEKAPQKDVTLFEELSVGAPPGMDPQAIGSEARRIETTTLTGEREAVFVAPTKAGGYCAHWEGSGGGGCDKLGTTPLSVGWWMNGRRASKPASAGIALSVNARYVASIELRFSDGVVLRPPLTWVSAPIDRGFFFHRFAPGEADSMASRGFLANKWRPGELDAGRTLTVVALDDEGRVVTEAAPCCKESAPQADAVVSQKKLAVSISTTSGPAVIWTAPTGYEGTCAWLEFEGRARPIGGCMPKGYGLPRLAPHTHPTSETVLVFGRVDPSYRTVELQYANGDIQRLLPDEGFVVVEIPQRHLRHGTRLLGWRFPDADGHPILGGRQPVLTTGVEAAACYRVLPLHRGQTCP